MAVVEQQAAGFVINERKRIRPTVYGLTLSIPLRERGVNCAFQNYY